MKTMLSLNVTRNAVALVVAMTMSAGCATAASNPAAAPAPGNAPDSTASNPAPAGAALPAGVVATVNGTPILQSQIDQVIAVAKVPDNATTRTNIKNQLIARELFRQAAEQKHYDTRPEVLQAMQEAKVNAETQLFLRESIHAPTVTDAQVKARYDEIVAGLGKTEYKPRLIEVTDDASASAVLAKLSSGQSFDTVARQDSIAANKATGGELPWVSFKLPLIEGKTQGLPLPLAQAIVQLPAGGTTSSAIVVNGARFIVKVDALRPTQIPAFDQAKPAIRTALEQAALQTASGQVTVDLLKNARIQQ